METEAVWREKVGGSVAETLTREAVEDLGDEEREALAFALKTVPEPPLLQQKRMAVARLSSLIQSAAQRSQCLCWKIVERALEWESEPLESLSLALRLQDVLQRMPVKLDSFKPAAIGVFMENFLQGNASVQAIDAVLDIIVAEASKRGEPPEDKPPEPPLILPVPRCSCRIPSELCAIFGLHPTADTFQLKREKDERTEELILACLGAPLTELIATKTIQSPREIAEGFIREDSRWEPLFGPPSVICRLHAVVLEFFEQMAPHEPSPTQPHRTRELRRQLMEFVEERHPWLEGTLGRLTVERAEAEVDEVWEAVDAAVAQAVTRMSPVECAQVEKELQSFTPPAAHRLAYNAAKDLVFQETGSRPEERLRDKVAFVIKAMPLTIHRLHRMREVAALSEYLAQYFSLPTTQTILLAMGKADFFPERTRDDVKVKPLAPEDTWRTAAAAADSRRPLLSVAPQTRESREPLLVAEDALAQRSQASALQGPSPQRQPLLVPTSQMSASLASLVSDALRQPSAQSQASLRPQSPIPLVTMEDAQPRQPLLHAAGEAGEAGEVPLSTQHLSAGQLSDLALGICERAKASLTAEVVLGLPEETRQGLAKALAWLSPGNTRIPFLPQRDLPNTGRLIASLGDVEAQATRTQQLYGRAHPATLSLQKTLKTLQEKILASSVAEKLICVLKNGLIRAVGASLSLNELRSSLQRELSNTVPPTGYVLLSRHILWQDPHKQEDSWRPGVEQNEGDFEGYVGSVGEAGGAGVVANQGERGGGLQTGGGAEQTLADAQRLLASLTRQQSPTQPQPLFPSQAPAPVPAPVPAPTQSQYAAPQPLIPGIQNFTPKPPAQQQTMAQTGFPMPGSAWTQHSGALPGLGGWPVPSQSGTESLASAASAGEASQGGGQSRKPLLGYASSLTERAVASTTAGETSVAAAIERKALEEKLQAQAAAILAAQHSTASQPHVSLQHASSYAAAGLARSSSTTTTNSPSAHPQPSTHFLAPQQPPAQGSAPPSGSGGGVGPGLSHKVAGILELLSESERDQLRSALGLATQGVSAPSSSTSAGPTLDLLGALLQMERAEGVSLTSGATSGQASGARREEREAPEEEAVRKRGAAEALLERLQRNRRAKIMKIKKEPDVVTLE